jgi:Fic family protein
LPLPAPVVPPPPPPPQLSVEERWAIINERLVGLDEQFQREYRESFEMSWVYHDSALEGVVYTFQELKTAIDPNMSVVADSGLQPVCDEIRRHRQAIEYVRELSEKKRVPINVDTIKKIYCILHPEEGDVKTVKYRKDIPQHRLYFHEYAAPDKIAYKARQVIDWLNGPEPKKLKSPIRIAARVHYDLLRVFPFPQDSGKVSRLLMNVLLMRAGHPPAIIHSTERQRYYEALKGQLPVIVSMVSESIMNALLSIEKKIEDHDATKSRGSSPPKSEDKPEKPEKPTSAVAAVATARDDDSDLYLDQEMDDSDSDGDSDSDDDGGED